MTATEGQPAPSFTLQDQNGHSVSLDSLSGSGVVLFFYPKAFTPGCTTEACDFRDSHVPLEQAGYRVFGVSPDPVARLADFQAEHGLPYPLLSDPDHEAAESYGAWGKKKNYGKEYMGIIRSTFVIDGDGVLTGAYRNIRAKGHVAHLRADLLGED